MIAGGIAAAAVSLVLLAFGIGVGFSVVSPWSDQGVSSTTFSVGAGIYLVVVAMLASTVGGYLAGRLRNRWAGIHQDEVYFRDTAHGFLAWAFATVLERDCAGRGDHPYPGRRLGGVDPGHGARPRLRPRATRPTSTSTHCYAPTPGAAAAGTPAASVGQRTRRQRARNSAG